MKISVSSYSFHQYIRQGKLTQLDTIDEAKKIGLEAIEFTELNPKEGYTLDDQKEYALKLKKRADELGMDINAYTIGVSLYCKGENAEQEINRLKGQLDVAKILGAKVLRHDSTFTFGNDKDGRSYKLMLPTIAENTRKITEYGQSLGIKTCTENHGYIFQDSYRMEELFNAVNHENFGLLVDMGNFVCADDDNALAVSRLAPYAVHVHCKDFFIRSGKDAHPGAGYGMTRGGNFFKGSIIGQGCVPVKQCLRILKRAGYDGYASIEYEGAEDCIQGITAGFNNLKRYISEIESEC